MRDVVAWDRLTPAHLRQDRGGFREPTRRRQGVPDRSNRWPRFDWCMRMSGVTSARDTMHDDLSLASRLKMLQRRFAGQQGSDANSDVWICREHRTDEVFKLVQ